MIRILLVEDHVSFAQAMAGMIGLEPDLEVAGIAARGDDAVAAAVSARPDVAIVDLDLPGTPGIEVLDELRDRLPNLRCIVLTALTDPVELGRAVQAGAHAVQHKSVPIDDLFDVVRAVVEGRPALDGAAVARWMAALASDRDARWEQRLVQDLLSTREREVLDLLARGHGSTAIARSLTISEATVLTHIRNLRAKLGVGSRLEAVTEGLRLRLIEPPP